MRRVFILVLLGVLTGCASQANVPEMPPFTTTEGKFYARDCQKAYAECVRGCSRMEGGAMTAFQRAKALNDCKQILEDCYKTCE